MADKSCPAASRGMATITRSAPASSNRLMLSRSAGAPATVRLRGQQTPECSTRTDAISASPREVRHDVRLMLTAVERPGIMPVPPFWHIKETEL